MVKAESLMEQAASTAGVWMSNAIVDVENLNIELTVEAKATLIAAYMTAAAQDQHTMTIRALAEEGLLKVIETK